MSKITRVFQNIFAVNAGITEIAQFGSLAAGVPNLTSNPAVVQALAEFTDGWFSAILGSNSPAMEDMNCLFYLAFRQLAYIFQAGISEWDSTTVYYIGSLVNSGGVIYSSLTDTNTGNALTDTTKWKISGKGVRTVTGNDTATLADDILRLDATGGAFTETLPPVATSLGKIFIMKEVNYTNANRPTIKANAAELINGTLSQNTLPFLAAGDSYTLYCNGASWDII